MCMCVCPTATGVGGTYDGWESLRYGSQSLVVVGFRGLNELQLCLKFRHVGEEISPHYLCQSLHVCV